MFNKRLWIPLNALFPYGGIQWYGSEFHGFSGHKQFCHSTNIQVLEIIIQDHIFRVIPVKKKHIVCSALRYSSFYGGTRIQIDSRVRKAFLKKEFGHCVANHWPAPLMYFICVPMSEPLGKIFQPTQWRLQTILSSFCLSFICLKCYLVWR